VRVTYGNLKGGVGKSTSSVYTALGLAAAGAGLTGPAGPPPVLLPGHARVRPGLLV